MHALAYPPCPCASMASFKHGIHVAVVFLILPVLAQGGGGVAVWYSKMVSQCKQYSMPVLFRWVLFCEKR